MADAEEGQECVLPDELPLSDEEDLFGDDEVMFQAPPVAPEGNDERNLPQELPLSPEGEQGFDVAQAGHGSHEQRPEPEGFAVPPIVGEDEGLGGLGGPMQVVSVFRQRGRPNQILREAMQRAIGDARPGAELFLLRLALLQLPAAQGKAPPETAQAPRRK